MFRFLCFPVKVDVTNLKVTSREQSAAQIFEAANHCEAVEKAGSHIPLFEGEQMAVALVGKIHAQTAENTVALGQSN